MQFGAKSSAVAFAPGGCMPVTVPLAMADPADPNVTRTE